MSKEWIDILKPLLVHHIEAAMEKTSEQVDAENLLPWVGDDIYRIMADAAICVLRGMADAQEYMAENDLLSD